jgi:hypothetical protein
MLQPGKMQEIAQGIVKRKAIFHKKKRKAQDEMAR